MEGLFNPMIKVGNDERRICEKHGPFRIKEILFQGRKMGVSGCPECRSEKEQESMIIEKQAKIDEKWQKLRKKLQNAGIPKRYQKLTFDDYEVNTTNSKQVRAKKVCVRFASNFQKVMELGVMMVFTGRVGTGKTHLAMSIANSIIKRGYTAHYEDLYMMIADCQSMIGEGELKLSKQIKSYSEPDLLILDELGDQTFTDSELRMQNKIIGYRYAENKPTILLSNLPWDIPERTGVMRYTGPTVKSVLGSRLSSRTTENGGQVLLFDWEDHRPKKTGDWLGYI